MLARKTEKEKKSRKNSSGGGGGGGDCWSELHSHMTLSIKSSFSPVFFHAMESDPPVLYGVSPRLQSIIVIAPSHPATMLTARSKSATSDSHATHSAGTEREKNDTDCSLRENSFTHSVRLLKVAPQQGSLPGFITSAKCCANEGITSKVPGSPPLPVETQAYMEKSH